MLDADPAVEAAAASTPTTDRSFVRWAVPTYLLATFVLVVVSLRRTDGHLVFLTDDPAIHLRVARNLAFHGTWGVVPGEFQSASSSPMWTIGLAMFVRVIPGQSEWIPLLLNVGSAIALLAILGANQRVLRPSRHRPLDVVAVAIIVVFVLFLPALTVLGMEHPLHMALVLATVVLFHKRAVGVPTRFPAWLPYALLFVTTLVRFETMFLAAGLALAFLAMALPGWSPRDRRPAFSQQLRLALGVSAASFAAFALYAAFNRAMGQGWFPNSVLAKSLATSGAGGLSLRKVFERFTTDTMLAALTAVCVGALLVAWRQRPYRFAFPAVTLFGAVALHMVFSDVGWYERYQGYLIVIAVYTLLVLAEEVVPATRRPPARAFLIPGLVVAALLFSSNKVSLTVEAPKAMSDTYEQRYQAGQFLARYYDDQPVATGELGYISLDHRGPVTDLLGLGDYEVLQQRRQDEQKPPKSYWANLARERGFRVAAVYPQTLFFDTPDEWILVGEWTLPRSPVTAFDRKFQFWATTPDEVRPLEAHLREFQETAPPGVRLTINEFAEYRADQALNGG